MAHSLMNELRLVPGTSESLVVGGDDREITVEIDPVKAAAYAIDPQQIAQALAGANLRLPTDRLEQGGERVLVRSGQFLRNAADVGNVVVQTHPAPLACTSCTGMWKMGLTALPSRNTTR
jgi:multidrug efflux pump subunit AcrB